MRRQSMKGRGFALFVLLMLGGLVLMTQPTAAQPTIGQVTPGLSESVRYFARTEGGSTARSTALTPDCPLDWRLVPGPDVGSVSHHLMGVAAVSANDVWAVGSYSDNNYPYYNPVRTLITHWSGTQWSVVPSPNVYTDTNELLRVAAVSRTDVWAVGYSGPDLLIEHWDGTQWSVIPGPTPGESVSSRLNDITALSATNVWAAGYYDNGSNYRGLILHWDGTQWSVVPNPGGQSPYNAFTGISAVSPNDIWAVGCCDSGPGSLAGLLTEHWDGTQWTLVTSGIYGSLREVAAISSNDVWGLSAYGSGLAPEAPTTFLDVVHWDGTQWSSPDGIWGDDGYLNGIAAASTDDVWVVGTMGGNYRHAHIWHWDGTEWNWILNPHSVDPNTSGLNDVAIVSGSDAWSVGFFREDYGGPLTTGVFMHYSTTCPTAPISLVGHVTWQGRPAQPDPLQQLPITLTLSLSGGIPVEYADLTTDASGYFTVEVGSLPYGIYNSRVKGPKYLANSEITFLTGAAVTNVDMYVMRAGDCNDDNVVDVTDFTILKNSFGKSIGESGYDDRADFTGNEVVNAGDFVLLRSNFGQGGATPIP